MKKTHDRGVIKLVLITTTIILFFWLTFTNTGQPEKSRIMRKLVTESENTEQAMKKNTNRKFIAINDSIYKLPDPVYDSEVSIEYAIANRRSRRNYTEQTLSSNEISQILWAAYGITQPYDKPVFLRGGLKSAPSAGALYPLEIYLLAGNVSDIPTGLYKYIPTGHRLKKFDSSDLRSGLARAALNQSMIKEAPSVLVYTAVFERTTSKYGERGKMRYVPMEVGHSAQNVYLQATALGLGTCAVGAFEDNKVKQLLDIPANEEPMMIMPLGYFNQ